MRGFAFALLGAGALALGVLTSSPASADCYGDDCYDGGYRSSSHYSRYDDYDRDRPRYHSYRSSYRDGARYGDYDRPRYRDYVDGHTVWYERGPAYTRVVYDSAYDDCCVRRHYHHRPYYSDHYRPYYRSYHSGYYTRPRYYSGGHDGCGYDSCGYRTSGCGYYDCGYRTSGYRYTGYRYGGYSGCGYYGCGHRGYRGYSGYYGYYPRVVVGYGGAWTQTASALGYGGYGCHAAYIPYGWTWYRATSC